MATFDLGRVTPLYKGDYSASASYELNDVVLYNGNLYWHVQATATVGIAPTDTTVWKLAFADEGVREEIRGYADDAQASKTAAAQSASQASASASNASASASQAALSATSAQTAETGATASAQTASSKASEASTSAQSAASSAQTVTDKATLASQKAAAASESATLATAKASAASASETNAAASAQTATAKASEAAASATSAQEYDESAQASAVNAQTAQGLAEQAQTAAETAQGLAEDARDLAQQYAESIDPEHIYSAYPTDTASGAVVSFMDGADDIPLKSLVVDINPVQSGSGDPSPDNVRPISGWSEVNVQRTGENLFPYKDIESQTKNGVTFTVEKSNGVITNIHMQGTATTAFSFTFYITGEDEPWVLPKGEFKFYIGGDKPTQVQTFDINIRKAGTTSDITVSSAVRTITLSEQTTFGSAYIWIYSGAVLDHNIIPVIVQSGADTSAKYPITQRQDITIDLGQTVYGGTLDVTKGELVINRAMVDLGTLTWNYVESEVFNFRTSQLIGAKPPANAVTKPNAICSILPVLDYTTALIPVDGITIIYATSVQAGKVWAHSGTYSDAASFKTAVTGQQLVYELATPITIQLTPHEVRSLLGQNNIFADTGDTEVEYRADTKLYIERLTEPDADMIADANIVSGQYFMVGNSLYLATANIASGSAVIVGTNCTQKSLSEALNEINQ